MKIALTHLNLSVESGDPRMFYSIARALQAQGHAVTVYTAQFDPRCFPDLHKELKIEVVQAPLPLEPAKKSSAVTGAIMDRLRRIRAAKMAVAKLARHIPAGYDMLIAENDYSYQLGKAYKKISPITTFVWLMNNTPYYREPKTHWLANLGSAAVALWEKFQVKRHLAGIDLIVVHDLEHEKDGRALGKPVLLLRIPVDFAHFFAPVTRREQGNKTVTLLSVGSLSTVRKFEDTISAAAELRRAGYDARAVIVCKDFWKNADYKETLLAHTAALGMETRAEFMFEGASEEELLAIQKRADVFVFPNHINIWGMAALEAMAAGLPLVVSSVTSIAEVLEDGTHALMSEPGKPESIAQRIRELVDDPARCRAVAEAGQEYVKRNLTWESYAKRLAATRHEYHS